MAIYKCIQGFKLGATVNSGSVPSCTRTRNRWIASPTRWPFGDAA